MAGRQSVHSRPPSDHESGEARTRPGRARSQLQRLCRQSLAVPLRHAHLAERDFRSVDRHLDAVCGMERGDLCGAGRGRPRRRGGRRRALSRFHARGSARAWSALVLRRVLCDLPPAGMTDMAAATSQIENRPEPIAAIADFMAGFSLEATRPSPEEDAALAANAPPPAPAYLRAGPQRPP